MLRRPVAASTGLRKNSVTPPRPSTTAIVLRSFASTQIRPAASSAIPSAPSSAGCSTRTASRQRVSAGYVVSQPTGLVTRPVPSSRTFHSAPRAVSATTRSPLRVTTIPLATMFCGVGVLGVTPCNPPFCRPTPMELAIVGMRNASTPTPPAGPIR